MKVRTQDGVRFVTGLALALSLAAQACVADTGDEDEIEAARPAPQAVEPGVAVREEPAGEQVRAERPRALAGQARPRTDQRSIHIHKAKDPVFYPEPPPNPW